MRSSIQTAPAPSTIGEPVFLTDHPGDDVIPAWSPDVTRIAFHAVTDDGTREIFAMRTDGTELVQLTDTTGHSDCAWWTAGGGSIHFESDRTGSRQVFSMRPDGNLTQHDSDDRLPAWPT